MHVKPMPACYDICITFTLYFNKHRNKKNKKEKKKGEAESRYVILNIQPTRSILKRVNLLLMM